jgi:rhodanese-related sulfurtransferase
MRNARYRSIVTEASAIIVAAVMFGFGSTAIGGKGFFRPSPVFSLPSAPGAVQSTFLTFEQTRRLYYEEQALFIDARHAYDFGLGHIKGAVNIPLNEFDRLRPILADVPKDRILVVYCDGEECNSSAELAKMFYGSGYQNVKIYFGGWNEWLAHKQPTER